MRPGDIDVLVFTSDNRLDRELAAQLRKLLMRAGYKKVVIVIEEEWERRETYFSSRSGKIDMRRYLRGDPKPFRRVGFEFDYEALEDEILSSRGIVFVNPFFGSRLPEPFEAAIELIHQSQRIRNAHKKLLNRYICCYASDSRKHSLLDNITFDLEVELLHDVQSLQRDASSIRVSAFILALGIGSELLDQLRLYEQRTSQEREGIVLGNLGEDADRVCKLIDENKDIIGKVRQIDPRLASAIESSISE